MCGVVWCGVVLWCGIVLCCVALHCVVLQLRVICIMWSPKRERQIFNYHKKLGKTIVGKSTSRCSLKTLSTD